MSRNEKRAQALAEQLRAEQGLGEAPIKDLFELVHTVRGVDVLSMDATDAEHGLSMLDPATGRVVIAVATTPHPMRQRSSVAHELGHVLAGDLRKALTPGERSPEEIRADAFARHLLLPLDAVRRRIPSPEAASLARLSDLVQEFEVSPAVAAIQLQTLRLIDAPTRTSWSQLSSVQLATRFGWLSQYRSLAADSAKPRAPQGLMARAVEGYRRGLVGMTELAAWYGQERTDLEQQLQTLVDSGEVDDGWALEDDWDDHAPLFPDEPAGPA
jgi:Zn-dependent peptidase ImmA (M78 family)